MLRNKCLCVFYPYNRGQWNLKLFGYQHASKHIFFLVQNIKEDNTDDVNTNDEYRWIISLKEVRDYIVCAKHYMGIC